MKIGNIIYEFELVNHTEVDYINYYKEPKRIEEINHTLPTLYVGWSFLRKTNLDNELIQNANILKHNIISDELYWEFSFDESKASHVEGIENFINNVPDFYFRKYNYTNLDPVFFQIKDLQDLFDVLPRSIDKVYFFKNQMIYFQKDLKIVGLNMEMYDFFKFDIKEIINYFTLRSSHQYDDPDGLEYQKYYKIFPNYPYLKRYIIVLLTK